MQGEELINNNISPVYEQRSDNELHSRQDSLTANRFSIEGARNLTYEQTIEQQVNSIGQSTGSFNNIHQQ